MEPEEKPRRSMHYERVIEEYWADNWPKMVAAMKEKGTYDEHLQSVARTVSNMIALAAEKGLDHFQAEEFAREIYQRPAGGFCGSEQDQEDLDENGWYK